MHDPSKPPPDGDVSKCPFFAAFAGALSSFTGSNPAKKAEPNGADAPAPRGAEHAREAAVPATEAASGAASAGTA